MSYPFSFVFLCFVQHLGLYLIPLLSLCVFYNLSKCILLLNGLYIVRIASVFHLCLARESTKTRDLISSVSASNKTLCRWQYVACAPRVVLVWAVMGMYRGADKSLARQRRK